MRPTLSWLRSLKQNKTKTKRNEKPAAAERSAWPASAPLAQAPAGARCPAQPRYSQPAAGTRFRLGPRPPWQIRSAPEKKSLFTRSGVRTHADIRPLDLKSNALTTRPSWCTYRNRPQTLLHTRPRSPPVPHPADPQAAAAALPPRLHCQRRRAQSEQYAARGRPRSAASGEASQARRMGGGGQVEPVTASGLRPSRSRDLAAASPLRRAFSGRRGPSGRGKRRGRNAGGFGGAGPGRGCA